MSVCWPSHLNVMSHLCYRLSTETRWYTWQKTACRRKCSAPTCVTTGEWSTSKTTLMKCSKVNLSASCLSHWVCLTDEAVRDKSNVSFYIFSLFWLDSQRWRTAWMWRATQPGLSSTTSSGMKDTPRGSDSTTSTSGTKINRATRRPRSSSINASSALTASPTRERWTLTTPCDLKSSLELNNEMLTFRLIVTGGELEEESCGDLLLQ